MIIVFQDVFSYQNGNPNNTPNHGTTYRKCVQLLTILSHNSCNENALSFTGPFHLSFLSHFGHIFFENIR